MSNTFAERSTDRPMHPWLRRVHVVLVRGPTTPLLKEVANGLLGHFRLLGHNTQATPDDSTDVILTTARFGEPLSWRKAMLFTARRRFGLSGSPVVFTLVHMGSAEFRGQLNRLRDTLAKEPPDAADYVFSGLAPRAYRVLFEQGRRGGPMLALERVVQAQAKSIRSILVVGDERPLAAYHFDLAGGYPRSGAEVLDSFYKDIVLRIVTSVSTSEVNQHTVEREPIPRELWQQSTIPAAMCTAGKQLGKRNFFTEMVRIPDLVQVPAVEGAVATQYSEGCFATWDPTLAALIATVTGSARPVDKGNITEDELAVIVGVRPDGKGALVRHVEEKRNDSPSTEAVEMMDMDSALPSSALGPRLGKVPVARSKLHGHRGIAAYDPRWVEYVPLEPPYHHYLVSCATGAQARGIKKAFSCSEALQDPEDPRQVVFTVLPGHGTVIVEKWVPGTAPFQVIWEYMDAGYIEVENCIPQGPMGYVPDPAGRMLLQTAED